MKVIDFTSGSNPLGPSNKARNIIRTRLRQISAINADGLDRLKNYIAKKEGIDDACILFGCGSTVILNTILDHITPKRILIPYPVSKRHKSVFLKHSLECVTVPLKAEENYDLTIKDFCDAMHGCGAALLPNPHDVTGTVISDGDITKIADNADELGISLLIDEAYSGYASLPSLAVRVSNSKGAAILRTFSTFHALGGLRLGYVIGPPDFINQIRAKLDPSWINTLAPWAAIASMKDKGYQRRTLLFLEGEKAYIQDKLSGTKDMKCSVSPSNILVVRHLKGPGDVQKRFERNKVHMNTFVGEDGNICIPFPIQNHRLNAYFVKVVKKMMGVQKHVSG